MSFKQIFEFLASLKLTVVILCFALVLVFAGTLAQVTLGLYQAQHEYFRSFFVYWQPGDSGLRIPVLPGGYLVGTAMLLNLIAAQIKTFEISVAKLGLQMVHLGIILLLLGQLATDILSRESTMHIREGESKNYSELSRRAELAIVDATDPEHDRVIAISQEELARGGEITHPDLPFTIRVQRYMRNSVAQNRKADSDTPPAATQGMGVKAVVTEAPLETQMERRDMPSAIIELAGAEGSLGTWLVSFWIDQEQHVHTANRDFRLSLRPKRLYKPYTLELLDFNHEVYPGTQIPKDFSSVVRLKNPSTGEDREVRIYMNNPLRYKGDTFYQSSYDTDDKGTILQVVRNPSWLAPYFSCVLVGVGLVWQSLVHLIPYLRRRQVA